MCTSKHQESKVMIFQPFFFLLIRSRAPAVLNWFVLWWSHQHTVCIRVHSDALVEEPSNATVGTTRDRPGSGSQWRKDYLVFERPVALYSSMYYRRFKTGSCDTINTASCCQRRYWGKNLHETSVPVFIIFCPHLIALSCLLLAALVYEVVGLQQVV